MGSGFEKIVSRLVNAYGSVLPNFVMGDHWFAWVVVFLLTNADHSRSVLGGGCDKYVSLGFNLKCLPHPMIS